MMGEPIGLTEKPSIFRDLWTVVQKRLVSNDLEKSAIQAQKAPKRRKQHLEIIPSTARVFKFICQFVIIQHQVKKSAHGGLH